MLTICMEVTCCKGQQFYSDMHAAEAASSMLLLYYCYIPHAHAQGVKQSICLSVVVIVVVVSMKMPDLMF